MAANSHNRDLLVRQLAWQHELGIDEILLDEPAPDEVVTMAALVPPSRRREPAAAQQLGWPPAAQAVSTASDAEPAPPQQPAVTPTPQTVPQVAPSLMLAAVKTLEELRTSLAALEGCALKNTAANMVFADGNPGARLMVVGDVPGRDEDRVGLPLVGPEGQLFDRMLASIGLSRADCYIVPLIPWRPPGNRTPTAEEMDLLLPWLRRHVQLAMPEMLMLLGGVPAKALLPEGGGILKLRGRWHNIDYGDGAPRPTLATLHPAYLLRSPPQKRLAFADLLALAGKLG